MNSSSKGTPYQLETLWVIGCLCISVFPQLLSMPLSLVAIALLPVGWRLLASFRGLKPVPMPVRVFATALAIAALVSVYGSLMGRRAAVSMLVLMLSLKLLETFSTRDARIVVSLGLFVCATQFLFSQGILMIIYIIICLLSSLIALMYTQRREAYEDLGEVPRTSGSLFTELGFGLRLMVIAFPIGLTLFLLFPRWSSPLWGLPEDTLDARSGLSDSMTPGSIQSLFMDDSPAFRVKFEGDTPQNSELYWRGPVFWDFDGRSWQISYFSHNLFAESKPDAENAPFRYEVQMEPTEQRWLFALDYPALEPRKTDMTMDYQLLSQHPVTQLNTYVMASDPDFMDTPELEQTLLWAAIELPEGFNPRTASLMAEWRSETKSDAAIVQRALTYFNQEQFHYTLNPSLLSKHSVDEFLFDTQEGFCEHYASAFTVMMRMAGIPARVVTGYQGGWFNNIGSYLLVRQSDAHAWSEVWISGSGWTRIDPTAAVAPSRVERGAMDSLEQRRHMFDFEWMRQAKNTFDLFQRGWNNWVVTFGLDQQSRMFSMFGWSFIDSTRLVVAMVLIILLITVVIFMMMPWLLKVRSAQKQDPLLRLWYRFIRKLEKAGFVSNPAMAPMELAAMASGQLEYKGDGIARIAELYLICRYSRESGNRAELTKLINDFSVSR